MGSHADHDTEHDRSLNPSLEGTIPDEHVQSQPSARCDRRRLVFHLVTILVVLSPLAVAELVLRLCVPAPPPRWDDPYVTFSSRSPLFVRDPGGARFETAADRLVAFRPQSFAARKSPETFRIFCLGGSTVQGRPYSVETSFTTWLRLNLEAAQPERDWEVVNVGGISYASYRLAPVMRELLAHEPDLFVLYTGHNEFLEDRTYADQKRVPRSLARLHRVMLGLRSYALADRWLARRRNRAAPPTVLAPQVQTRLDLDDGLTSYHRDPAWRRGVVAEFGHNLESMVRMARSAGVSVILVNPVSNLKDCPPFKSEFRTDLTPDQRQRVTELWERARALDWSKARDKIELLERAAAVDDQHAGLLFLVGMCHERIGQEAEARQWFVRAKEADVCPLRILEPMHEIITEVAGRHDVPLVDARAMIEARSEDGIPGDEWLLDHVHPTISGHQLVADALSETMVGMDLVRIPDHWQDARERLWHDHVASLNDAYYAQGVARLKRLQEWSRGRIHRHDQ